MASATPGFALWDFDCEQVVGSGGLIGVDEAGRGALAGPVVAGAVWAGPDFFADQSVRQAIAAVNDSKQLKPEVRAAFFQQMTAWAGLGCFAYATGEASVEEIERHNILGATRLAMARAVEALQTSESLPIALIAFEEESLFSPPAAPPDVAMETVLLIDGRPLRPFPWRHRALVGGDSRSLVIALASIAAKVTRDRLMAATATNYPHYAFASNKGYGTIEHRRAIARHGVTPLHRRGFIKRLLSEAG